MARSLKIMSARGLPWPMQNHAGVKPPIVVTTATATDSSRNAGVHTRYVANPAIGTVIAAVTMRDRMLS